MTLARLVSSLLTASIINSPCKTKEQQPARLLRHTACYDNDSFNDHGDTAAAAAAAAATAATIRAPEQYSAQQYLYREQENRQLSAE